MKLAIVGTDLGHLDSSVGALEKLCLGWAKELRRQGAEVYLLSILPSKRNSLAPEKLIYFTNLEDLNSKLDSIRPDIAITNNRPLWQLTGTFERINIFHNYPDAWMIPTTVSDQKINEILSQSHNFAVSQALANQVNQSYASANTKVLYPFIDNSFIDKEVSIKARNFHKPLKLLFPNRTLEKKGLRWVIQAIDHNLSDLVQLTVVRNISPWYVQTPEHTQLLKLAVSKPFVEVVEKQIPIDSLISLYLDHDVVITPSIEAEGLGLIPLEAQALGLPVIATDIGGLKESVFSPNLTIEPYAEREFIKAVETASGIDPKSRVNISNKVKKQFSLEISSDNLLDQIRFLLNGNSLG